MWTPRRSTDDAALALFEESGRTAERAAGILVELLREHPERADLGPAMVACEHDGDRITRDVIHHLHDGQKGHRSAFALAEGLALATGLDDIVDFAEQAADQLSTYGIEAPMEQATLLAAVLAAAAGQVAGALRDLRAGTDLTSHLAEIHRLEDEGDRLTRDAVASLFANGVDPMVVIRWKDVFASLEAAIDACESVAHILEGILLARR